MPFKKVASGVRLPPARTHRAGRPGVMTQHRASLGSPGPSSVPGHALPMGLGGTATGPGLGADICACRTPSASTSSKRAAGGRAIHAVDPTPPGTGGRSEWASRLTEEDRRGLTPLFWTHVNPASSASTSTPTWTSIPEATGRPDVVAALADAASKGDETTAHFWSSRTVPPAPGLRSGMSATSGASSRLRFLVPSTNPVRSR